MGYMQPECMGDHPCNFTLKDQNDQEVSLYDFYGSPIVLDLERDVVRARVTLPQATDVQATVDRFAEHNVRYI